MKFYTLLLFSLFIAGEIAAQTDSVYVGRPIVVEDISKTMSKGNQPGFKIDVYQAKKTGAVNALTKTIKEENRAKLELVNNEYVVHGAVIKDISSAPMNVYSIVNEYEDHVELLFFYEKDSAFLSKEKNESEYLSARKFTRDFAVTAYRGAVQEQIDAENKKLKDLESQLQQLTNENDKLKKGISEENQKISSSKEKISSGELDQERVRKQILDQKGVVDQARSGTNEELEKEEEKKLKGYENDLSKLENQEDGLHKSITNSEANVREYERSLTDNETAVKLKQEEVTSQKDVVNKLQKKLDGIQ